jgi:hypothetical protein
VTNGEVEVEEAEEEEEVEEEEAGRRPNTHTSCHNLEKCQVKPYSRPKRKRNEKQEGLA